MPDTFHVLHPDDGRLNEYLDGALDAAEQAGVAAHLAGCPACHARRDRLAALAAVLADLPDEPLARDLAPAVVAAVRRQRPEPLAAAHALRILLAAQGLAAVLIVLLAWPTLAASLPGPEVSLLAGQAGETLSAWRAAAVAEASATASGAGESLAAGQAALDQLAMLMATRAAGPLPVWTICLAAVALLWLVGNGLLLRPAPRTHTLIGPRT
jgi:anti-sigma factor RsiW